MGSERRRIFCTRLPDSGRGQGWEPSAAGFLWPAALTRGKGGLCTLQRSIELEERVIHDHTRSECGSASEAWAPQGLLLAARSGAWQAGSRRAAPERRERSAVHVVSRVRPTRRAAASS